MAPKTASPADIDNAIQAYCAGEGLDTVARAYRIGYQRLKDIIVDRGLLRTKAESEALRTVKLSAALLARLPLPIDEIAASYLSGVSEKALADRYGVSRNVIAARLRAAGVSRRTLWEAEQLVHAKRTPEQYRRYVQAAHAAVRGSTRSFEELCMRACTRERKQLHASPQELRLQALLAAQGVRMISQKAIGPYNADLGAFPVAVEVFGGNWHAYGRHATRFADRTRYILDQGWNLVIVWTNNRKRRDEAIPISAVAADYIAAFFQESSSDPTIRSQYRVIWGDGQPVPTSGLDLDDIALVPSRRRR